MKKVPAPLAMLVVATFLAPILGGQVATDQLALAPSDLWKDLLGGAETPLLSHAIVGCLACVACAMLLVRRKIVQVPNNGLSTIVMLFFGLLTVSTLAGEYRFLSLSSATEWLTYGAAFYAVVAGAGRKRGPMAIQVAIVAGCTLLGLLGIWEYGQEKAIDPTWRIFSLFANPNGLAAMLLIGLLLGLGLLTIAVGLEALVAGVACLAMGLALVLTGSKGALLALVVGLAAFAVTQVAWKRGTNIAVPLVRVGSVLAMVALFIAGVQLQARGPTSNASGTSAASGAVLNRLTGAADTSEQSADFRKLLWKSAIRLIETNPAGSGIGSFAFVSAEPGLTTQTHFAHQTYLQLAVEGSPFLTFLFLAAAVTWIRLMFRGASALPFEQNRLRSGVFAAIMAVGAHNLVDSDLYYYGIGFTFFVLLGLGLLLSADAVAPENVPGPLRKSLGGLIVLLGLVGLFFGVEEVQKGELRNALITQERESGVSLADELSLTGAFDGEAWSLRANAATSPSVMHDDLARAAQLAPSARNLRALARVEVRDGATSKAEDSLRKVLRKADPNNLPALLQLGDLYEKSGDDLDATQTYERLVQVESTPYFQIRSLPQFIPTETYTARVRLALLTTDPSKKIELLAPAIAGFAQYLKVTFPQIKLFASQGSAGFGGESLPSAAAKMKLASEAATQLAQLYRDAGDRTREAATEAVATEFAGAASESK